MLAIMNASEASREMARGNLALLAIFCLILFSAIIAVGGYVCWGWFTRRRNYKNAWRAFKRPGEIR